MAKPLADRTRAALEPSSRLKDVENVLAENEAALAALRADLEAAEANELDATLTPEDARVARDNTADLRFEAARTAAAIEQLKQRVEVLKAGEGETVRRRAYDAAKAARDELVRDLQADGAAALSKLAELAARITANDALIATVNGDRPNRGERLISAEVIARGALNESFWPSKDNLLRIVDIRLPYFDKPDFAWPRRLDLEKVFAPIVSSRRTQPEAVE